MSSKTHTQRDTTSISKQKLREGMVVPVFEDYELELGYIGPARLIRKVKSGLPFILEETSSDLDQTVYQADKWIVDLEGKRLTQWIRYVKSVGIVASLEEIRPKGNPHLVDSFLKVDGIEIW